MEWTVFAVSTLLVLAVMAVLGMEALRWGGKPAHLEIKRGDIVMERGRLCLPVTVTNTGDSVAVNVNETVAARGPGGERSVDLIFDFIPRGATREGRAAFPADQDPGQLEVHISGYETP